LDNKLFYTRSASPYALRAL